MDRPFGFGPKSGGSIPSEPVDRGSNPRTPIVLIL